MSRLSYAFVFLILIVSSVFVFKFYSAGIIQHEIEERVTLAENYFFGKNGVEKDVEKALRIFEELSSESDKARYYIAMAYELGLGNFEKNTVKAVSIYERLPHAKEAQEGLAWLYFAGEGVSKDMQKSFEIYEALANEGYHYAKGYLGWFYFHGEHVEKDQQKARMLFEQALAFDDSGLSHYYLGYMSAGGITMPVDVERSERLYAKARLLGYTHVM